MDYNVIVANETTEQLQERIVKADNTELLGILDGITDATLSVLLEKVSGPCIDRLLSASAVEDIPVKEVIEGPKVKTGAPTDSITESILSGTFEQTDKQGNTELVWKNGIRIHK